MPSNTQVETLTIERFKKGDYYRSQVVFRTPRGKLMYATGYNFMAWMKDEFGVDFGCADVRDAFAEPATQLILAKWKGLLLDPIIMERFLLFTRDKIENNAQLRAMVSRHCLQEGGFDPYQPK